MDKNDSKVGRGGCPVLAFQRMVSGKYKIRILWDLKDGARRYGEIRSGLLRGGDVCVPNIRFGSIGGEGHRGSGVT